MWVLVGAYTMNAGTGNYTRITNYAASGTRRAIADAMRFYSVTAGDTTPPVISGVSSAPGVNSAIITWTTDEAATSQVEYGLTAGYGSQTTKDTGLVTSHSVTVSGLTSQTLFHFRVKSDDGSGNPAASGDYQFTTAPPVPEVRAIWADTWHNGFLTEAETTNLVNTMAAANYNVLIPEIRKSGDAYYNSAYEPWATNISPGGGAYDPLADMLTKCHAQGIEVHGWFVAYRVWRNNWPAPPANHVWTLHPEWAMKTNTGSITDGTSWNLDPGVPGVQDYLCKVVTDCVSKYPTMDGVNFDYIRYPGTTWGYNELTMQRFFDEYGYMPPTTSAGAGWSTWCDYRRQQVSDLMKKIWLEATYINPTINVSVDTVAWSQGNPNTSFEGTRQYADVYQNGKQWMLDHIVDMTVQMNYKREFDAAQGPDFRIWSDYLANLGDTSGRFSVDGNGAYLNSIADTVTQMLYSRSTGNGGMCNYSYAVPHVSPPVLDPPLFFGTVESQVYPEYVPVPEMTWKTQPTNGVIFGTVTDASTPNDPIYADWIYKATVSLSGPEISSTQTDATGTYGFLDLTPGTYAVTISKTGFPTQVITAVSVSAGQMVRKDVALGTVTKTSPAGVLVNGWSLISLPLQPVNPDPAVVLSGISIDGALYRWDNPTQSLLIYDTWSPEQFGNMDIENGYWLQAASAGTISYEANPSSGSSHDIPLPTAGWAIMGCPFETDRQWADTTVKHGAETVTILTAAQTNNWMNSTGYWWDAETQSLVDFGLPEDFVAWNIIRPWHGYWVQTYVNDITLTLQ